MAASNRFGICTRFRCAGRLLAYGVPGLARVRAAKAIHEDSHMIEKQGGNMHVHEGTKRKDPCLNAESSITCSQKRR